MNSKDNRKPKTITQIGNVILTDEALESIEELQEQGNEVLHMYISIIRRTVCFMAKMNDSINEKMIEESKELTMTLAWFADLLSKIQKP